jgi:hypothetical protein
MNEKICRNCRHWEKDKDSGYGYDFGRCGEILQKVDVMVDGDAVAHLDIEDDFGCILFKKVTP